MLSLLLPLSLPSPAAGGTEREEVAAYNAHTLQWGEAMVGTSGVHAGLLPRVQLGTRPLVDALGLPNANLRIGAIDSEILDLAITGTGTTTTIRGLDLSVLGVGAIASVEIDRFGLHGGLSHARVRATGMPSRAPWWLPGGGDPLASAEEEAGGARAEIRGGATTLRSTAELRLVGRVSLLAMASRTWSTVDASLAGDLSPDLEELSPEVGLQGVWSTSLAVQAAFGRFSFRGGAGWSNVPLAWLTQAAAAHVRLGSGPRRAKRPEVAGSEPPPPSE